MPTRVIKRVSDITLTMDLRNHVLDAIEQNLEKKMITTQILDCHRLAVNMKNYPELYRVLPPLNYGPRFSQRIYLWHLEESYFLRWEEQSANNDNEIALLVVNDPIDSGHRWQRTHGMIVVG